MIKSFKEYCLIYENRGSNLRNIRSLKLTILKHCAKLYLYPDTIYVLHWMKEVRSRILSVNNMNDGKPYDINVYYDCLVGDISDENNSAYDDALRVFGDVIVDNDLEPTRDDFKTFIRWYEIFMNMIIKLVNNKTLTEQQIFDLMHSIFEIPE
jgi:hypothetical protein